MASTNFPACSSPPRTLADADPADTRRPHISRWFCAPCKTSTPTTTSATPRYSSVGASATICQGTIGLLTARDHKGGWLFQGYGMTGYSYEEEQQADSATPHSSPCSPGLATRARSTAPAPHGSSS
jgi:hypothetical protein